MSLLTLSGAIFQKLFLTQIERERDLLNCILQFINKTNVEMRSITKEMEIK